MNTSTLGDLLAAEKEEKATAASAGKRKALEAELEPLDHRLSDRLGQVNLEFTIKAADAVNYLVKQGILTTEEVDNYKGLLAQFKKDHFGKGDEYYRAGYRAISIATPIFAVLAPVGVLAITGPFVPVSPSETALEYLFSYMVGFICSATTAVVGALITEHEIHKRFEDHTSFHAGYDNAMLTDNFENGAYAGVLSDDMIRINTAGIALRQKLCAVPLNKPEGWSLKRIRARMDYGDKVHHLRGAINQLDYIDAQFERFGEAHANYMKDRIRVLSELASLPPPSTQSYASAPTSV